MEKSKDNKKSDAVKVETPKVTLDDLVESGKVGELTNYEKDLDFNVKMLLEDLPF